MSHGQPRILFLTLTDDTGSERIVSEMGRLGAACGVMGRPGTLASLSRRVSFHHRLPSHGGAWMAALGIRRGLASVMAAWRPDAVVPLDDMAAALLRDVAGAPRTSAALRDLLERSLGSPAHYVTVCSRERLIDAAGALGIRTPAQHAVRGSQAAADAATGIGFPLMLKREGTCGGSGVAMVRDAAELARALRAASRKAQVKRTLRGLFGFRPDREGAALTLQAHVTGRLAMRTVACQQGRVLEGMSFVADQLDPPVTGSSTVLRPLDHPEMSAAALQVVAALGLSGFASFDFILTPDDRAFLIEMNARPVGSGHLAPLFGHDLYRAWLSGLSGSVDRVAPVAVSPPRAVALFPKELGRDPASPHIASADVLHDVPGDEPLIIEAYRARLLARHPDAGVQIARALGPARGGAGLRAREPVLLARSRT